MHNLGLSDFSYGLVHAGVVVRLSFVLWLQFANSMDR